jgi:hypothetical protein
MFDGLMMYDCPVYGCITDNKTNKYFGVIGDSGLMYGIIEESKGEDISYSLKINEIPIPITIQNSELSFNLGP